MSVPNNMDMTNLMSQHPNPLLGIPPAFFLRAASERYQRLNQENNYNIATFKIFKFYNKTTKKSILIKKNINL